MNLNIKSICALAIMAVCSSVFAQDSAKSGGLIRLVDALDEPEFYCIDLAGWGEHLQLDDPLQAHTCKVRNNADQLFELADNRLLVSAYDRCLQVAGSSGVTLPGSAVLARPCSAENPLQNFGFEAGKILVGDTGYCLGAGEESEEASGPSHLWRTLTVVDCSSSPALTSWQFGLD